jgi:anti-sigma regulatory factor (Ser/Thr protein kinase)
MGQWRQQHVATAAVVNDAGDALTPSALAAQGSPVLGPTLRHGQFPAEPAQAARVRSFVRDALAGCATVDDAALLTSELFANAVVHSQSGSHLAEAGGFSRSSPRVGTRERPGSIHILVCYSCPGSVHITVIDDGSASAPTVRRAGDLRTTGRGLLLVQELAARWGHDGGEHGRAVWFELDCPQPAADAAPDRPDPRNSGHTDMIF